VAILRPITAWASSVLLANSRSSGTPASRLPVARAAPPGLAAAASEAWITYLAVDCVPWAVASD
jgi:hypothetical protein